MKEQKTSLAMVMIMGALMAFTSLSTDIYLPAMPQMAQDLQGNAELTVTGFLAGFALAQLIWGPISDRIGRKIPLYVGMLLFAFGSVGCALAETMPQMVAWRVFQAFGACTGPMLARAMVRDLFAPQRAAQMLSTLTMIMAVAPIIGPLLGGQIIRWASWQAIFGLLAGIAVVMVIAIIRLPETLLPKNRENRPLVSGFSDYLSLFTNREYLRYVLCVTFFYVAAYAFITGSPQVYIDYFGVDPQHYGWLFALNIIGVMVLSQINRRLVTKVSLDQLLKIATLVATTAGAVLAVLALIDAPLPAIVAAVFVFFSSNGVIAACATASALSRVPSQRAGAASALLGSFQYGSGIISSVLLALFSDGSPKAMALIIAVFSLVCLVCVWRKSAVGI